MNIASAEQTIIDSITTDPEHPRYVFQRTGLYYSYFTIIVHVTNPPPGGQLYYTNYCLYGQTTIDDNGMASFPATLQINIPYEHECLPHFHLEVSDAAGNLVASAEKSITIYRPGEIPEFPSIALPLACIIGLILVVGRRKE